MFQPTLIDQYAGLDQMLLWDEDAHPREPSGTSKGGQFAARRGPRTKGGEKLERNTAWGKLRLKGTSEDHTQCMNCGRGDLKKTVVFETLDDDGNGTGEFVYLGTECAVNVTGTSGGAKKIKRDAAEADYREEMEKLNDERRMKRVADTKHEALHVAIGTNRFRGDRHGNGVWMTDGKQWVRADKSDEKDIPFFKSKGFEKWKPNDEETTKYATIAYRVHRYATEAQREAGNYKMRHIRCHGLAISIETPKGQRRNPAWPPMPCDYGYIKGTEGRDGDHVDVFLGPDRNSELVVVVDQVNQNGRFDEHKCLLGFQTTQKAIDCYKSAYSKGWKLGPVTTMTIEQFKSWLKLGRQSKELNKQVSRYAQAYANDDLLLLDTPAATVDRYDWQSQPRAPEGQSNGGQWVNEHGSHNDVASRSNRGFKSKHRPGGALVPIGATARLRQEQEASRTAKPKAATANPASLHQLSQRLKHFAQLASQQGGNNSQKPMRPPGEESLSRSTKKRDIPELPGTINKGHSLHLDNLPPDLKQRALDIHLSFSKPLWAMRFSHNRGDDAGVEKEWAAVDKSFIRQQLDAMNQLNREAESRGVKLHEFVNANGLIPRALAERLDGGSRFFDPRALGNKLKAEKGVEVRDSHFGKVIQHADGTRPGQSPESRQPTEQEKQVGREFREAEGDMRRQMLKNPALRAAIEQVMGIASPAGSATETAPEPSSPEQEPEPEQPKWQAQTAANLSSRAKGMLRKAAAEEVGDNPEKIAHFSDVATQAWQEMQNETAMHNEIVRTISQSGKGLGALVRWARLGEGDVDTKRNFDELVNDAISAYPQLGSTDNISQAEDSVRAALAEGVRQAPATPSDPAVIERARGMVGPGFFDDPEELSGDDADVAAAMAEMEISDEGWEAVPFSLLRSGNSLTFRYSKPRHYRRRGAFEPILSQS